MKYADNGVYRTKSGLFIRRGEGLGLLIYSPFTGLMFVVHPKDIDNTISWMNLEERIIPNGTIRDALGVGWDKSVKEGKFPMPHYLEDQGKWESWPWPRNFPIIINWFLTGNCPLACKYCDAEDLMRHKRPEPKFENLKQIASTILSYNPLSVVLTGGEPLVSPHLEECIKLLHNRTGIILDTNGLYVNKETVRLFKKYQVVVRISMDSAIAKYNDSQRCFLKQKINRASVNKNNSSLKNVLQSLCLCLDENLPVSVQTVATRKTINDLPSFGDRLYRLGIRSWRIHLVSVPKNNVNYKSLSVSIKSRKNTLSKLISLKKKWRGMDLQILDDINRNSVVIISPDGEFLTESNTFKGKIPLDPEKPFNPDSDKIFWNVSPEDHARRYLSNLGIQLGRWLDG